MPKSFRSFLSEGSPNSYMSQSMRDWHKHDAERALKKKHERWADQYRALFKRPSNNGVWTLSRRQIEFCVGDIWKNTPACIPSFSAGVADDLPGHNKVVLYLEPEWRIDPNRHRVEISTVDNRTFQVRFPPNDEQIKDKFYWRNRHY